MKVYVKKGENESSVIHYIITMIILSIIILVSSPIVLKEILYFDWSIDIPDYEAFIDFITMYGMSILWGITFAFIILFVYFTIIFLFVKPPKKFKAKLVSKKTDTYNGREITYMKFTIENKKKVSTTTPLKYRCFTYDENDLTEGNYYLVKIKEFNWKIREVENLENDIENKLPVVSLFIPFLMILFIFGGMLIMASLRMDFCIRNGLPFLDNLPALVISSIFVLTDLWIYLGSRNSSLDDK